MTSTEKTYGISVVGSGYMADKHLKCLSKLPRVKLQKLCSTEKSAAAARALAAATGVGECVTDFNAVVNDKNTDIVLVSSPDAFHADMTEKLLKAGKHTLCEKPLGRSEEEFERVATALKNSRAVLQVGMNCRFREQYSIPKNLIDAKALGALRFVRGTYIVNSVEAINKKLKPWMLDYPKDVTPFLHGGAIHCLDLVRWIGGEVGSVFARASGFELKKAWGNDTFSISFAFAGGATGELLVSAAAFRPNDFSLELWCADGSVIGNKIHKRTGDQVDPNTETIHIEQKKLDLQLEWEDLFEAIEKGRSPLNSLDEALKNFRLLKAIERSIATRQCDSPTR